MSFCFSDSYKELSDTVSLLLSVLGACAARSTDQVIKEEQNHIACLLKSKHQCHLCHALSCTALYQDGVKNNIQKTEQNGRVNVPSDDSTIRH